MAGKCIKYFKLFYDSMVKYKDYKRNINLTPCLSNLHVSLLYWFLLYWTFSRWRFWRRLYYIIIVMINWNNMKHSNGGQWKKIFPHIIISYFYNTQKIHILLFCSIYSYQKKLFQMFPKHIFSFRYK